MRTWYNKLGFHNNPFSIKPAVFHDELIGYNLEGVFEKIEAGGAVFIEGDYGTGKTTLLKRIVRRFGGNKQVVYYNTEAYPEGANIKALLKGRDLFGKYFGMMPENMIFLVDEAQNIKAKDTEKLLKYMQKGNIKSVVFVGTSYKKAEISKDMRELLDSSVIQLQSITPDQAVDLVRKRIGNIDLLSDEIIKKLFKLAGNNPRHLLEYCEEVSRYAVNTNSERVEEEHIKEVLKEPREEIAAVHKPKAVKKKAVKKAPKKIKEHKPAEKQKEEEKLKRIIEQAKQEPPRIVIEELREEEANVLSAESMISPIPEANLEFSEEFSTTLTIEHPKRAELAPKPKKQKKKEPAEEEDANLDEEAEYFLEPKKQASHDESSKKAKKFKKQKSAQELIDEPFEDEEFYI